MYGPTYIINYGAVYVVTIIGTWSLPKLDCDLELEESSFWWGGTGTSTKFMLLMRNLELAQVNFFVELTQSLAESCSCLPSKHSPN